MLSLGFSLTDLHSNNIIVNGKNFYAFDFEGGIEFSFKVDDSCFETNRIAIEEKFPLVVRLFPDECSYEGNKEH